jgi:hypothetical protein
MLTGVAVATGLNLNSAGNTYSKVSSSPIFFDELVTTTFSVPIILASEALTDLGPSPGISIVTYFEDDGDISIKYFDGLGELYSYVCHELVYDDLDIEDFKNYPYSGIEERLEEYGSSWYIFEGEKEIFNLKVGEGDLKDGDWDKFTDFCLGIKESKIMNFKLFTEGKKDKFPNIQKLDIDGFVVYVGKDAKSNDHLTFNIADKEDIWMHVKGVPGSHVVIRVRENLPIDSVIKKSADTVKDTVKKQDADAYKKAASLPNEKTVKFLIRNAVQFVDELSSNPYKQSDWERRYEIINNRMLGQGDTYKTAYIDMILRIASSSWFATMRNKYSKEYDYFITRNRSIGTTWEYLEYKATRCDRAGDSLNLKGLNYLFYGESGEFLYFNGWLTRISCSCTFFNLGSFIGSVQSARHSYRMAFVWYKLATVSPRNF